MATEYANPGLRAARADKRPAKSDARSGTQAEVLVGPGRRCRLKPRLGPGFRRDERAPLVCPPCVSPPLAKAEGLCEKPPLDFSGARHRASAERGRSSGVEHNLAKVGVGRSNRLARSILKSNIKMMRKEDRCGIGRLAFSGAVVGHPALEAARAAPATSRHYRGPCRQPPACNPA